MLGKSNKKINDISIQSHIEFKRTDKKKVSNFKDVLYNIDGSLYFNNVLLTSTLSQNIADISGCLNCCVQQGITQLGVQEKSLNMGKNDIFNLKNVISTIGSFDEINGNLKTPLPLNIINGITQLPMQQKSLHMGGQNIVSVGNITSRDASIKNIMTNKIIVDNSFNQNLYFTKGLYCNDNHRYNMVLNCEHKNCGETLQFYTCGEGTTNKDIKMELKNCKKYKMKVYGNLNLDNNEILNVKKISLNNYDLVGINGILYYDGKKVYEEIKKDYINFSYNGMQLDVNDRWGSSTKNLLSNDVFQKCTNNDINLYSSISNRNILLNDGYITLPSKKYRIKAKIIFNLDLILSSTIKFSCYDNNLKLKETLKNLEQDGQYIFELDFIYISNENTQLTFKIETDAEIISNQNELDFFVDISE